MNMKEGILVIDKPLGMTSMHVICILRKLLDMRKIGHAGTLDPLATGILLVCVGKATKQSMALMNLEKEYETEIDLSAFSETDDAQGPLLPVDVKKIPTLKEIKKVCAQFIGSFDQVPPEYSAVKINGVAAYKRKRRGEEVSLSPKKVFIKSMKILSFQWPKLKISFVCSKGTYVRSVARDLGKKLETGGYVSTLRRTRIGSYLLEKALTIEKIEREPEKLIAWLLSLSVGKDKNE